MINEQNIKEALSNIKVSKKLDQKILALTLDKKVRKKSYLKVFTSKKAIIIIILLLIFTTTTVFAKDFISKCILKIIEPSNLRYTTNISLTDPVYIPKNTNISCQELTNLSNIESTFQIKFIFNTSKYNDKIAKCSLKKDSAGHIESIDISILEFYDYSLANQSIDLEYQKDFTQEEYMAWNSKRKMVDLHLTFMTQYASLNTKEKYQNYNIITSTGGYLKAHEFYFENLNTIGYYFISPSSNIPLRKELVFIKDNILYEFSANKPVELQELFQIINEFSN